MFLSKIFNLDKKWLIGGAVVFTGAALLITAKRNANSKQATTDTPTIKTGTYTTPQQPTSALNGTKKGKKGNVKI